MSTLYKPVEITSAEQAEALPIGTVATQTTEDGTVVAAPKRSQGADGFWWDEGGSVWDCHMTGWTALVPIEAEEDRPCDCDPAPPELGGMHREGCGEAFRYITAWQETDQ